MPAFNVYGAADLAQLAQAYRDAEANILRLIAQALEKGAEGTGNYYKAQYSELSKLRHDVDAELAEALSKTNQELAGLLAANSQGAAAAAVPGVMPPAINTEAINALTLETAASMASMKDGVLRSVNDTFRKITRVVSTRGIMSGETMKDRLQAALNEYAAKGLTAYTDASGRQWKIDSYAEMALRTATNRAQNQGRTEQFKTYGINLIRTSQHMGCSDLCLPYQGKILSLDGRTGTVTEVDPATGNNVTVTITATMDDAIANGYHHPNAVLGGEQSVDTWGKSQAGSKSFYRGPSVTIRTSEGNSLTVSPNHPILTGRGWVTAQTVRKSDNLFNSVKSRPSAVDVVGTSDLNNVIATVEEEFATLKSRLNTVLVPTAGHDFNDDRQFLEGEVSVVVPDGELLPVPDAHIVQETGEVLFNWSDVCGRNVVGEGSELLSDSPVAGASAPLRSLLDDHPGSFQTSAHSGVGNAETRGDLLSGEACFIQPNNINRVIERSVDGEVARQNFGHFRAGDSRDVGDVIDAVPGGVQCVDVVDVEFGYFEGHAYDFQTEDGIYAVNGLIIHNCRHTDTAYIPGTPDPEPVKTDEEEAAAEQAQRYNERQIRAWKRREAVAINPQDKSKASAKVRQWQAQQREHLKANPWLQRRYDREQVRAGVAQRATGLPAEPRLMPKPSTPAPAPTPTPAPDVPRRRRRAESGEGISVAEILARNKKPAAAVDTSAEALKKAKLEAPLDHVDIALLPDAVFKEKTPSVTLSQLPKTTRTSWDDIAKDANVNKGVGNCIRVANTVELRRRGYDVTAGQTEFRIINRTLPNQTILKQSMRTRQELATGTAKIKPSTADIAITGWNTADDGSRVYFQARKAQSGVKYGVNGATLKRFQDDMPDGASGTAVGVWKKKNFGHIWNWVKQDGKIRFFEAQTNKGFIDVEEYMPNLSNGSLMMVRMDDLTPNDNVLKVIDYENRI